MLLIFRENILAVDTTKSKLVGFLSFFKNVSSSTSHIKTLSLRLSLQEFKKIHNTLIYESILIKMYMNANIMNTKIVIFF